MRTGEFQMMMDGTLERRLLDFHPSSPDTLHHFNPRASIISLLCTEVGKAFVACCRRSKHPSHDLTACPISQLSSVIANVSKITEIDEVRKLLSISVDILYLFLQANWTGPAVAKLRPTEQALEERRLVAKEIFKNQLTDNGPGSESEQSEAIQFWKECPFGHPDDRVSESQSLVLDDKMLESLAVDLSIDGEVLSDSVRGVCYLWLPVKLISAIRDSSLSQECVHLKIPILFLESRIAYFWQQCLASGCLNPSPSLMKKAVAQILGILENGEVFPSPFRLFPSTALQSVLPTQGLTQLISAPVNAIDETNELPDAPLSRLDIMWRDTTPPKSMLPCDMASILVELSIRLTYFGRHELGLQILESASSMAGFKVTFDSVLGIRREFQVNPHPQLVVRVSPTCEENNSNRVTPTEHKTVKLSKQNHMLVSESENNTMEKVEQVTKDSPEEKFDYPDTDNSVSIVRLKDLDSTTDILEKTKYTEGESNSTLTSPLSVIQHLILLAHCFATFKSAPSYDPITLEQLRAIVERCMNVSPCSTDESKTTENRLNWLLYSTCLWFRSKAEFHRSRTHDRALLQLQALVDQFWDKTPDPFERLFYVGQLPYPMRSDAAIELGRAMMSSGALMSAFEMFKEMWMWEEAAECLIASGRKAQALDVLEERLKIRPTPRILSCIGDIKEDYTYYEKAWDLSNGHYARAQRSLAKYWFLKGDLEKSSVSFEMALKINPMFESSWFTLGVCQMNLQRYDEALQSFGRVVSITNESAEAWANLSAIHTKKKSWNEAMLCINEAVKRKRDCWRIWENYICISVKLRKFRDVILGMRNLIDLGKTDSLKNWMFIFLADVAITVIDAKNSEAPAISNICQFFDNAINSRLPDPSVVYALYANICSSLENYQKEYELRWKHFRSVIATIPDSFDPTASESVASLVGTTVDKLILSHRKWSSDETTTEQQRSLKNEELCKTLEALKDRLEKSNFSTQGLVMKLQEHLNMLHAVKDL